MTWGGRCGAGQRARLARGRGRALPVDRRRTGGRHIRRKGGRSATAAGETGDTLNSHSLKGLGESHLRQDGGETAC
jgi:hypothetical protein